MLTNLKILNPKYYLPFLLFLALALNVNTLFHQYALDDFVMLTNNKYVEKGISGIPEILTTDLMSGCTTKENLLSQPRYRPFALVIFAVEHQFFGNNPFVSHLINVLLFALLIALLFQLLHTYVFRRKNAMLAFLSCLLFVVHPIHTEVIANVKSRDELITFVLLIVSLITLIKYLENRKLLQLLTGLFCFFLALLTRESAVTFIGVVPLILYFFYDRSIKKAILFTLPLIGVFACYLFIRFQVIGFKTPVIADVLNNPYLYSTTSQAFATKTFMLLKYILLLVFPFPLSYDYSYNQIPYINLSSWQFLISAFVLITLLVCAIISFRMKSLLSFSILYFFITVSLVSNYFLDIGTLFSERLLFQSSLAFCIALAFLFLQLYKKAKPFSVILLMCVLLLFSIKTISRNSVWKNNETLFTTDVISSPNSARTTFAAAEIYRFKSENESREELKKEYLQKAINYCEKSISILPAHASTYVSMGFAYFDQLNYDTAAAFCLKGYRLDTTSTEARTCVEEFSKYFYMQGNRLSDNGNTEGGIKSYLRAIELNAGNVEAWYNLGLNYFALKDSVHAYQAWKKVKVLDPNHVLRKEDIPDK